MKIASRRHSDGFGLTFETCDEQDLQAHAVSEPNGPKLGYEQSAKRPFRLSNEQRRFSWSPSSEGGATAGLGQGLISARGIRSREVELPPVKTGTRSLGLAVVPIGSAVSWPSAMNRLSGCQGRCPVIGSPHIVTFVSHAGSADADAAVSTQMTAGVKKALRLHAMSRAS